MREYRTEPGTIELASIPVFQKEPDLAGMIKEGGITAKKAGLLYRDMLRIRYFEEKIVQLKMGLDPKRPGYNFVGASHLYAGQEAVAVGAIHAIEPEDYITSNHRGHGHCIAKGGELNRMMAELVGKKTGYCKGKGGSMHIADVRAHNLGANGVVAGSYGIAVGAGISCKRLYPGRIVVSFAGDGATNNGIAHEALNMASALQTPVIFLIENNGVGMTGPVAEITNCNDYLVRRSAAYCMPGEVIDGQNVLAVYEAVQRHAALIRKHPQPVMLEALTYRVYGHSLSDNRRSYRTREEEEHWNENDALKQFRTRLTAAGVMSDKECTDMEAEVLAEVEAAMDFADESPYPDPAEVTDDVYAFSTSDDEDITPYASGISFEPLDRGKDNKLFYWQAVNEAIREEMVRDRRVVMFGEDIAAYGGAFGVSRGLAEMFGPERIWNTAISEAAIAGSGVGAALTGLRPIAELMYIDFTTIAMDQIVNQAAKIRYMFGGMATVPLVIRVPVGGGKGYAGQHSQSLESWFTHVPGLKIVAASTPYDAKGLLKTAIRDDNPVLFIEHQLLYSDKNIKQEVPLEDYTIPFGVADIKREGSDVTIITYLRMVHTALEAAERLAEQGIEAEVVDLRTLAPLDINTVTASVKKTGKALVLSQACRTGSFTAEIASRIQETVFDYLDAPVMRIGAQDSPPPMSPVLEEAFLPSTETVIAAVTALVQHRC